MFSVIVDWCTVKLCSMQYPFFLWDNTFCFLSVDRSPRVPPKTKRGVIEKIESEQPGGTVHEIQQ